MRAGYLADQSSDVETFQATAYGLCLPATDERVGAGTMQAHADVCGAKPAKMMFASQDGREQVDVVLAGDVEAGVATSGMLL